MDEEWSAIEGYATWYEISNLCRIRSYKNNKWGLRDEPRMLKFNPDKQNGYPQTSLIDVNGKRRTVNAHKLVMAAFGPPKPSDAHEICHRDGNSTNCQIENLYWGTRAENVRDAIQHGTAYDITQHSPKGSAHHHSKLNESQVKEIRSRALAERIVDLAKEFGVSSSVISSVVKRRTWKHVED